MAKVGGSGQVALECVQAAALGRQPVEESSPAPTAAWQVERVPLHAAGARKVGSAVLAWGSTRDWLFS